MHLDTVEKNILTILFQAPTPLRVSTIAKHIAISRTALYRPLESLEKQGLIIRSKSEQGDLFSAISFAEYKKWKTDFLQKTKNEFDELDNFAMQKKTTLTKPEVRYFTGKDAVKNLYHDSWRNNPEKIIYAITDYEKAYETFGTFMENDYFPARIERNISVQSILARSRKGRADKKREKELLREMKFIRGLQDLGIEINIYHDRVSLVQFNEKNPTGVLIINKLMAESFKKLFGVLWRNDKK